MTPVAGYAFISYSRTDRSYVDRLSQQLESSGVDTWYDYDIHHGDRFDKLIAGRIDDCAAFVIVMTPEAFESDWVNNELARAQDRSKPVIPILLRGDPFITLRVVDYVNALNGS